MYRVIHPGDIQELPLRMLFHPVGEGVFVKACEADSYRGLVAALMDDPVYESGDARARLVERLRLANDVALLAEVDGRRLRIAERDAPGTIVIASDEAFMRSLEQVGFVSLLPARTTAA